MERAYATGPLKTEEETAMKDSDHTAVAERPAQEPPVLVASGRKYLYAIVAGGEATVLCLSRHRRERRVHHYRGARGRRG